MLSMNSQVDDNPKTGHDEDEKGDQDLDVQKVNEEDSEPNEMDEDRGANEKELMNDATEEN